MSSHGTVDQVAGAYAERMDDDGFGDAVQSMKILMNKQYEAHQFALDAKRSAFERQRLARQLGELYQEMGKLQEAKRWMTEAERMPAE